MGLGQYPCGIGPCGLDPLPAASAARSVVAPTALLFDGASRDFPINPATGRYYGVTSVAQRVELALLIAFGKVPAVPALGIQLANIVPVAGAKLQADVENAVKTALAVPLQRGDIALLTIRGTSTVRGRITVYVRFQDLRDPLKPIYELSVSP